MGNIQDIDAWRCNVVESSEAMLARTAQLQAGGSVNGQTEMGHRSTGAWLELVARAPWAYSTRRVDRDRIAGLRNDLSPRAGDLVLARVDALGHHANLQLTDGRRRRLFVDDHIVVAYGNRYACEQFEAKVPGHLGPCHLVAGGGIAAQALSWHDRIARGPTRLTPIGLLTGDDGEALNLEDFALRPAGIAAQLPPVIAVVGTAMDAGKTQTAAYLVRGLRAAGHRAGYIKITGTGAGGDTWLLHDAGADRVLDFTDAGMASTYLAPIERIEEALRCLLQDMADHGIDTVVMEVADGVFQRETRQLIASPLFGARVGGVVVAARDAMGASAAVEALQDTPCPVLALSGLLSASPLQRREAQEITGLASANREELATAALAATLRGHATGEFLQREVG